MKKNETLKPVIMRCMVMRLDEKDSLAYLEEEGYDISRAQFYRIKKNIQDSRFERLSEIAKLTDRYRTIFLIQKFLVQK